MGYENMYGYFVLMKQSSVNWSILNGTPIINGKFANKGYYIY